MRSNILIVDDDADLANVTAKVLQLNNYIIDTALSLEEAKEKIKEHNYDVIISDYKFPKGTGLDLLLFKNQAAPDSAFILLTAYSSGKLAMEALQLGAFDYISKPFNNVELLLLVEKAIENRKAKKEREILKKIIDKSSKEGFIYKDPAMDEILHLAQKVAISEVGIILIWGETGVGKEVLAKYIHNNSKRASGPFIEINCAALPENLLESELFGHEKGAFTGADKLKIGLFEIAENGTIFLDEIGELTPLIQTKLLRAIETKSFLRVGGTKKITTDVRIIAATNKNLEEEVKKGTFRSDLYYRLKVISFHIPPLRERKEDIKALIEHYLAHFNKVFHKNIQHISPEAWEVFSSYHWPGNVRELRNVMERVVLLTEEDTIAIRHIPLEMLTMPSVIDKVKVFKENPDVDFNELKSLEEIEIEHIRKILKLVNNNKSKAAKILKISRKTLWEKINKYNLE